MDLLPTTPPLLWAFILASTALALTPGPVVLFIIARCATLGRGPAMASVAGAAAGNLANAILASLGLAALFAVSSIAYDVVRWTGAAYLVFVGIRTLLSAGPSGAVTEPKPETALRMARDGFLVSLLNPKTTLFFAAFLPQFLPPGDVHPAQIIALGVLFVAIAACTDTVYAMASTSIAKLLSAPARAMRIGRIASGIIFIGLGIFAALTGRRPA